MPAPASDDGKLEVGWQAAADGAGRLPPASRRFRSASCAARREARGSGGGHRLGVRASRWPSAPLLPGRYAVCGSSGRTSPRHLQPPPLRSSTTTENARALLSRSRNVAPEQGKFCVYNSPAQRGCRARLRLRLLAGLALEALVCWEAQFGDFVNGAQVIIDQFIASAESQVATAQRPRACCCRMAIEGQGPELAAPASSASLTTAVLAATGRCATWPRPPQYLHALRRQLQARDSQAADAHVDAEEPAAPSARPSRSSATWTRAPPSMRFWMIEHLEQPQTV